MVLNDSHQMDGSKNKIPCSRKRTFFRNIRNYFREYCNCSSIHGFRYFGERRTIFERIWWFIVFSITMGACCYLILQVYRKWDNSPVIVSFATKEKPIYEIPFPAVTICPEIKSYRQAYNHTDVLRKLKLTKKKNINQIERKRFNYMGLICDKNHKIENVFTYTRTVSDQFFEQLNSVRDKVMLIEDQNNPDWHCSFMGKYFACNSTDFTAPIITDEGICETFNILDREDIYKDNVQHYSDFHTRENKTKVTKWSLDYDYQNSGMNTYPRRALYAGIKNGLTLNLAALHENIDYQCKRTLQGFRVVLHIPSRIPRASYQYFRVPLDTIVLAAVQPVMITTSAAVKKYKPERRQCFFDKEKPLKYFKIYTQMNCQMECLTNYTLDKCRCVNFFMPREFNTTICGPAKKNCIETAEKDLQIDSLRENLGKNKNRTKVPSCDCKPLCTDLSYHVELSQSNFYWKEVYPELNFTDKLHMSRLTIYFKSGQFIPSERNELYGPTDFLANFGGLLGLCTGVSVLSIMEIVYFLTVRLVANSRLFGYWAGPQTQGLFD